MKTREAFGYLIGYTVGSVVADGTKLFRRMRDLPAAGPRSRSAPSDSSRAGGPRRAGPGASGRRGDGAMP